MKNTTILNSNYTHLKVVSWKRGMKLCMADKVIVVEYYQDYEIISGSGEKFQVPKVVVLKRYI
jgi:hypothetical protein